MRCAAAFLSLFLAFPVMATSDPAPIAPKHRTVTIHLTDGSELCRSAGRQVERILQSFPPQSSTWDWYIVCGETRWKTVRMQYGNPNTNVVFTLSDWKHSYTFINAEAVWSEAFDLRQERSLRNVLAHEIGHVLCRCTDEDRADKAAAGLLPVK
jgi:hypothetical protein